MANPGRISGALLRKNLLRYGEDLAFENTLLYLKVPTALDSSQKVGINTDNPLYTLDINGKTFSKEIQGEKLDIDHISIDGNTIRSSLGLLKLATNTTQDYLEVDSRTFKYSTVDNSPLQGYSKLELLGSIKIDKTNNVPLNHIALDINGNVEVNGNIHATGAIVADGNLTLGDANTDSIEFKADILSNIIPDVDDTYDLGSLTKSWRQIYVDDMRLGGPEGGDFYNFAETTIPGSGTLPAKTFTGIDNPQNYTKISNTFTNGHLVLNSNGNGLIELINDTRITNDLNVLGDVATDNANYILMGDPEYGILSGAVDMTQQTSLTDGVAQLNLTLTLLVPLPQPSFPNATNLTISSLTQRIMNIAAVSQQLNGTGITAPAAGTIVYVARVNTFSTNTIAGTGPGNRGTLTVNRNASSAVTKKLTYGNTTQPITTVLTGSTDGSEEFKYTQPTTGVLVPGYLIKISASGTAFGGLSLNGTYVITFISSKILKLASYNTTTGQQTLTNIVANATATGQSLQFTTQNDNGTYTANNTSLTVANNVAYPLDKPGFHETVDLSVTGTSVPAGWNTVQILHDAADSTTIGANTTNVGIWYYDNTTPVAPNWSDQSFVIGNEDIVYSSSIPHYTNNTVYNIGFTLTWNTGQTSLPSINSICINTGATGPWTTSGNKTLSNFAYTILPTSTVSSNGVSADNNQQFKVNIINNAWGRWSNGSDTIPVLNARNGYDSVNANSSLPSLNKDILFKSTTVSNETYIQENNIYYTTFGTSVGDDVIRRVVNPDGGLATRNDTPIFSHSPTAFNSTTGLLDTDAVLVGTNSTEFRLMHNTLDYTNCLPAGPNLSVAAKPNRALAQYFTFYFRRTAVQKFRIRYTGSCEKIFVAMPGTNGTALKTGHQNSWLDLGIQFSENGGCAEGTQHTNTSVTNQNLLVSFGAISSSASTNNEVWVRIKLVAGQSLTSLYIQAA